MSHPLLRFLVVAAALVTTSVATAQQAGSIRGVVYDRDFDASLPLADVTIVETGARATSTDGGNFVLERVPPGTYTLIFAKPGYARQVRTDVLVTAGQLTDVNVWMAGDFTEMEEFVVQDIQIGGTEAALLRLRLESPALMDSISADLMSQAGASDAASAMRLIPGTTVQDGKFAVVRGLPDRFVVSQLNGVRLPTADEDKRAVQLDQFPSAIIETIQVSKTFTPDQQGDASGGAVNILLKGIPEATSFEFKAEMKYNDQVRERGDFLSYSGGGVNFWGNDRGDRDIPFDLDDDGLLDFGGAAGVSATTAPVNYKWSMSAGGKHEFDNGITVGGFANFFYERDSSYFDDGIDDSLWVTTPGEGLVPESIQGTPEDGDFKTALFDITESSELVQWGALGTAGIESEDHRLGITYLYTRTTEDTATLAEDTRGKAHYFPGYDRTDPTQEGNLPGNRDAAPYIRTETLEYTERTTETVMLQGSHTLDVEDFGLDGFIRFGRPEVDWSYSDSSATLYQPDKRQFGSLWKAEALNPGVPPFLPPFIEPALYQQFKPAANFTLGNFQPIWKEIDEESEQLSTDVKLPFEQWSDDEGYLKLGVFDDKLTREFNQDTFSNFNDNSTYQADWSTSWSAAFPNEDHPITDGPPHVDVDYDGDQRIRAWYAMADVPLTSYLNVIGGFRWESTDLSIVNTPEDDATWFPPGAIQEVRLNEGDADVDFSQDDVLPSIGVVVTPLDGLTFRAAYSETIARQTFKELTPILQQEFLGGPIFIGNPELEMASLRNLDFRVDYAPVEGSFFSVSYFDKQVDDPIEYVQRVATFVFTTPENFPEGSLSGWELEARQNLGAFWPELSALTLGANATLLDSEVLLPADLQADLASPSVLAPQSTRDMTGTPEHLYNLYLMLDLKDTGTQVGLFYTMTGDTLVAGAGVSDGNFVPDVYELASDTLNLSVTQRIGEHLSFRFQAKNLTNPDYEEVYRSDYTGGDVLKTSYSKGIEYTLGFSASFKF